MPKAAIEELVRERQRLEKQAPRPRETTVERRIRENKIVFAVADRFLDQAVDGPMHLKDPRAARIVEDAIVFGAEERYDLFAWCIMSNHVHVLLTPKGSQAGKPDLLLELFVGKRYAVSDGKVLLNFEEAEEDGYVATSPLNPELNTQAEIIEEAFANARDAAKVLRQSRAKLMRRLSASKTPG